MSWKLNLQKKIATSVLAHIGNTPLVQFHNLTQHLPKGIKIYAKAEYLNPGGSIKDRPALQMVLDGLESGALKEGKTILDSTSGNTGIALAMIGAILGIKVELCIPENVSQERKKRLLAYGAKLIYTSPLEGSDGAIIKAREIYKANPQKYFKPDQYNNLSNPKAHFLHTGPEIWEQTQGKVSHFIATIGTTGTIMGTGKFLKQQNSNIQIIAAEPNDAFHGLEGLKHMASSIVPSIYDQSKLDDIIPIPTMEAYAMVREICRQDAHFIGQSAGGAVWATLQLANKLVAQGIEEATITTVLCDGGDRYYSARLWDDV